MKKMLNEWWAKKATEIEEASERKDQKGVYEGTRELGSVFNREVRASTLLTKDGKKCATLQERKSRWKEHHETLFGEITHAKQGQDIWIT